MWLFNVLIFLVGLMVTIKTLFLEMWTKRIQGWTKICILLSNDSTTTKKPQSNIVTIVFMKILNQLNCGNHFTTYARMLSHFSRVWLFQTHWTAAHQAPLSMGFSRQEYWSGMPCPPPGDLPRPGTGPHLLCLLYWQGRFFTTRATRKAHNAYIHQTTVLYLSNIYTF